MSRKENMNRCLHGILLLLVLGGCATAPRSPAFMASKPDVQIEPAELKLRIYDYESFFASTVQTAANRILAKEEDFKIIQTALRWKINVIPEMQKAVFQADPLAAFAEAWILTIQMARFFDEGAGKDALEAFRMERQLILEELDRQLNATLTAFRQERIETTADLDALTSRVMEQSSQEARIMTDYLFRRVLQLLLVALAGVFVIGLVLRFVGRRSP